MYVWELKPKKSSDDPCWEGGDWQEKVEVVADSDEKARSLVSREYGKTSEVISAYGGPFPTPWFSPECASCKKLRNNDEKLPEGVIKKI